MALTVGDRPVRPLTADDVAEMVRAGILAEDDRVELLHGVLTAMSPQHPPHAVVTQRLTRWLAPLVVEGLHDVRIQLPFRVPDPTSLPEPDIAVIARDDAHVDHPREALLIIEVADSSLRVDTVVKPPLYASAGVSEYWVIDLSGRRLLRHTEPAGGRYTRCDEHAGSNAAARPITVTVDELVLGDLFAGL